MPNILLRGLVPLLLCGFCACGGQTGQSTGGANPKIVVENGGEKAAPQPPIPEDKLEPGIAKPGPKELDADPSLPPTTAEKPLSLEESLIPPQAIANGAASADEKYESKVADAFRFLTDGKEEEALAALQEAKAAKETEFVAREIERVQALIARNQAAEKTVADITTVLTAGKPDDASRLATEALQQYGDTDMAEKLTSLKRQSDALLATQLEEKQGKQRFADEAAAAVKAKNFRTAVISYEQAFAHGVSDPAMQKEYDTLRTRLTAYDTNRAKAAELRRDAYKLEEALVCLKTARDSWDTPQVQQEISETEFALTNRRDRLAVADFEVNGDVGIPLVGKTIAEEILPHFKGRFDLVERGQLESVLGELKLASASLGTNEVARTQVAQLAKARFLVVGSVGRLNGLTVNARLVDVRSGLIVQTAKIAAATPEELQRKLPALAKILQLSDEQKIAFDGQIAKAETIEPPKTLVIAEAPVVVATAPPPPPIIVNSYVPPPVGTVVIQDFDRIVVAPPTTHVVITEAPLLVRQRAAFISLEVGDNLFRRGQFGEAMRHFEFALNLAPDRREIALRIDRCRPHVPPVVVVPPTRFPRLAVLPFVEIGDPRILRPGLGCWAADQIAPYFEPPFDVVDKGELYYWMGRLGLTLHDVIVNPHARLVLARALNIRAFLIGNLRQELTGIEATAKIIDPEFNVATHVGQIRVLSVPELKFRLPELARRTLLPPAPPEQVVVIQQQQVRYDALVVEINKNFGNKNFSLAIKFSNEALSLRPNSVECRTLLFDAQRRQQQFELEQARQAALARELERQRFERERQLQLAIAAENARRIAEQQAAAQAAAQQQALLRQRQQAQVSLVIQARNNLKINNFSVAINLFESANSMNRTDELTRELAQARALAAENARQLALQQQQAQAVALQQQRAAELAAAQQKLIAEQDRARQAEQARALAEQKRVDDEYQRLMDVAQRAQAKGNLDAQVSALQAARRLKPTPEAEKLVNAALIEQAKASAEKKGGAARKELEQQLALERDRRVAAEAEAEKNRKLYEEALTSANTAMKSRDFDKAQVQFRKASLIVRTEEALKGLQTAQDELAKAKTLADAETRKKAEAETKEANFKRLLGDGQAAFKAKKYDQAVSLFKAATQLKPGNVDAQTELAKAEQAKADSSLEARKLKEQQEGVTQAKKLVQTANSNVALKQYDAAIVALNEALKLDPKNAEASKLLAQVQSQQAATVKDAQAQMEAKKKREEYEGLMQKGRTAMGLKNFPAALEAFQGAQKVLPGDATSAQLIKDVEKQRGDLEAARVAKTKQEEQAKQMAATVQQVRAAIRTNRLAEADKMVADAMKTAPNDPELKKVQGELAQAREAMALGEKKRLEEEKLKGEKVKTMLTQARTLIAGKKLDEADKTLAELGSMSPTEPELPKLREQVATLRKGMADEGELRKRQQGYSDAMSRGQAAMTAKKYDDAIVAFREALKLMPNDKIATAAEANAVKLRGEAVAAMEADAKKKSQFDQLIAQARSLMAAKRFAEASEAYSKAAALFPNDAVAQKGLQDARAEAAKVPKVEPKKEMPKVEPKKEPLPKVEPKIEPKKEPVPKVEPKVEPKKEMPKVEPKVEPKKETPKIDPAKAAYDQRMALARDSLTRKQYEMAIQQATAALQLVPNDPEATKIIAASREALKPAPKVETPPKVEPKKEMPKVEPKVEPKKEPPPKVEPKKEVPPKIEPKKEVPKVEPKKEAPKADPSAQVKQLLQNAAPLEAASKYAEAQPLYEQAVRLAPADALLKKKLDFVKAMAAGQRELSTGKLAEAILSFDQAVKLFPDNADAKKLLQQAKAKGKK